MSGSVAAEDGLVDVERTDGVDRAAEVRRVVVGELSRIDGQLAGVIDRAAETLAENDVVFSVVSERGVAIEATLLPKIQVDIVVSKVPVSSVIETAKKVLYTGHIGDGKIFVYNVENVVKVRTGEVGYDALQDVE